jgi:hypothetical protein
MTQNVCTHFIGFTDSKQFWLACQVFGAPDFIHRHWDIRAKFGGELDSNDVLVFAKGTEADPVKDFAFDDSSVM